MQLEYQEGHISAHFFKVRNHSFPHFKKGKGWNLEKNCAYETSTSVSDYMQTGVELGVHGVETPHECVRSGNSHAGTANTSSSSSQHCPSCSIFKAPLL